MSPQSSKYEVLFYQQLLAAELEPPDREARFHPTRKWKIDFAWPDRKIGVEIEGLTWHAGRHTRGSGFEKDCEKYGEAVILGWRILRVTADMVVDGRAIEMTRRLMGDQTGETSEP